MKAGGGSYQEAANPQGTKNNHHEGTAKYLSNTENKKDDESPA